MYDLYERYRNILLIGGIIVLFAGAAISGMGFLNGIVEIVGGVIAGIGVLILISIGITEQTLSPVIGFGSVFSVLIGIFLCVLPPIIQATTKDYDTTQIGTILPMIGVPLIIIGVLVWICRTGYLMFRYGISYREPYKKAKTHYVTQRDARKTYSSDYNDDYDYND